MRPLVVGGLLVASLATSAAAEDVVAESRAAIDGRVAELTPPDGKKERRELRRLEKAAAAIGLFDYEPDLVSSQLLFETVRQVKRSRSKDPEVVAAMNDLADLLGGIAAYRVKEADLCADALADAKKGRQLDKVATKAGRRVDAGWRRREKNVTRAVELWRKAVKKCEHGMEGALEQPLAASAPKMLLIQLSDTHTHYTGSGPRAVDLLPSQGGVARAVTLIGQARQGRDDTLLVHCGDAFEGDPMFNMFLGVPGLQLFHQIGVDAMAVGNHEVGFGPELLAYALSEAGDQVPPLLTANLDMSAFPALENWIQQSLTKDVSGLRVGFFGLTVPDNPTAMPDPLVLLPNVQQIAEVQVAALKGADADVIVLLSHLGYEADVAMAKNVAGIDVIAGGHDHVVTDEPTALISPDGETTRIVHVGQHYELVGVLDMLAATGVTLPVAHELRATSGDVPEEPQTAAVVSALQDAASDQFPGLYDTPVAQATAAIPRAPVPADVIQGRLDGPMGGLACDAYRAATGTQIAFTPRGLISEGLYQGYLVPSDLFRAVPYGLDLDTGMGLQLATATMSGADLAMAFEITVAASFADDDYFPEASGLSFVVDPTQPPGSMLAEIDIDGLPLQPDADYTVTMNTGTLMLLPLFGIEVSDVAVQELFEFEALMGYALAVGTLEPGTAFRARIAP
jgi:2',3'-cyclic-nucleotide 2'-phosphodiesterase (5'-nucleotidase family)